MKKTSPFVLAGLLCLAACGKEVVSTDRPLVPPAADEPTESMPAEETPAAEPAVEQPAEPDQADMGEWAGYDAHLPFILGAEKGLAEARKQEKPALFYYAATW